MVKYVTCVRACVRVRACGCEFHKLTHSLLHLLLPCVLCFHLQAREDAHLTDEQMRVLAAQRHQHQSDFHNVRNWQQRCT